MHIHLHTFLYCFMCKFTARGSLGNKTTCEACFTKGAKKQRKAKERKGLLDAASSAEVVDDGEETEGDAPSTPPPTPPPAAAPSSVEGIAIANPPLRNPQFQESFPESHKFQSTRHTSLLHELGLGKVVPFPITPFIASQPLCIKTTKINAHSNVFCNL